MAERLDFGYWEFSSLFYGFIPYQVPTHSQRHSWFQFLPVFVDGEHESLCYGLLSFKCFMTNWSTTMFDTKLVIKCSHLDPGDSNFYTMKQHREWVQHALSMQYTPRKELSVCQRYKLLAQKCFLRSQKNINKIFTAAKHIFKTHFDILEAITYQNSVQLFIHLF